MHMPVAFVMSVNAVRDELSSARPGAPVVPHVERSPRGHGLRLLLAGTLAAASRAVAPRAVAPADHPPAAVTPCGA